jgi:putative transposase
MERKYKFHDDRALYFVTFTVVYWLDIFIREEYKEIFYESIRYCQKEKGLEVYGFTHLVVGFFPTTFSCLERPLDSANKHRSKILRFLKVR